MTFLTAVILLALATLVLRVLLNSLRFPLSHVPGPWHTCFTNASLRLATIKGRRIHYVHALHQRYGPIVRLSPSEIDVSDLIAFRQVHSIGSRFVKSAWYESTHKGRQPGIFAMRDPVRHAQRRRLFARAFSYSSLAAHWESTVRSKVSLTMERILECAVQGGQGIEEGADVMKWWTLMATDVIAHMAFGESFRMLELGRQTEYIDAVQNALLGSVLRHEIPIVWHLLRWMPASKLRAVIHADEMVFEYGSKAIRNMRQENGGTQNLFSQMQAAAEKDDGSVTDTDIKTEAGNLIVAGSDTTAVTLTYLVWAVLKQPTLQKQLEVEVAKLSDDLSLEELVSDAPLLNSVIEETLRLYGAAAGALPRTVPKEGTVLCGLKVPGGVEVSTQAFTLHRDPYMWLDPLRFDGHRFMDKTKLSAEQKAAMHPFGAGSRICIGLHLAWMELRLGAAMFFKMCKGARFAACMTDEMMEMDNRFLIAPKGHCCFVIV